MSTREPAVRGLRMSIDAGVAHLTLDRPDRLNTIDLPLAKDLLAAALRCAHGEQVRAVLLDGAGAAFCAGGDLKAFAAEEANLPGHLRDVTAHLHAALAIFARLDAPVVAAVHGAAAGAGLGLVCAADVVLAAESARFVFAYTDLGLSPDAGTSWWLPRLVGRRTAMAMAMERRPLSAAEAQRAGLVTRVVPDDTLAEEAAALAGRLAAGPTRALGTTKRLLAAAWDRSYDEQLAAESELLSDLAATVDGAEGLAAFVEHRAPRFLGR